MKAKPLSYEQQIARSLGCTVQDAHRMLICAAACGLHHSTVAQWVIEAYGMPGKRPHSSMLIENLTAYHGDIDGDFG